MCSPLGRLRIIFNNLDIDTNDVFAPANYDFEYLFAITMAAKPLAWFESTGLPGEALNIAPIIKKYRQIQENVNTGIILPIGDEPTGRSWTGFQSIQKDEWNFIVFQERNDLEQKEIETYLKEGQKANLTLIIGNSEDFEITVLKNGSIKFTLPKPNSYALYKYVIKNK